MRSLLIALSLFASTDVSATPIPPQPPLFGLALVGGDVPPCVVVSSGVAVPGDYVSVILLSPKPQVFQARIGARPTKPCEGGDLVGEQFELVQIMGEVSDLAVAVITEDSKPEVRAISDSEWEIVGSNPRRTFRRCASEEGLHFTAWQGDRRMWHEYYYLSYSVDPTCSNEEVSNQLQDGPTIALTPALTP
jgi:hypothetical protein